MKQLVIMPGGFHPFHAGHLALYNAARQAFPAADVYVAATADTSKRPFPFEIKKQLASLAGVPADRFVQVKSTFQAQEIVSKYDPQDTQLIFVRSDKDRESPPLPGGTKKDGSPSYLQPYSEKEQLPLTQRGYMAYLATKPFEVLGKKYKDASKIRADWPTWSNEEKLKAVQDLYPVTIKNKRLQSWVVKVFDRYISGMNENQGWAATLETTLVNDPESGLQIRPEGGMGTWNESTLTSNLAAKFQDAVSMLRQKNYGGLYYALYGSGATRSLVKALADLEQFRTKQGNRPVAAGREIQVGEEVAGTPAVGGMTAGYQHRENQPDPNYIDERGSEI